MEGVVEKINLKYIIAIVLMLMFVFCDLLFDLALTFEASDLIAFIFTLLSAVIVFIYSRQVRHDEMVLKYSKITTFIKSNFDKWQVIFSILDIVCGLISILSTLYLAYVFKIVRFVYVPVKMLVVMNKFKSEIKPIAKFSYFWLGMRLLNKKGGRVMKNFLKSNKETLIYGFLVSGLCAVTTYFSLPNFIAVSNVVAILISAGVFILVYALGFRIGFDTIESLALRDAKKNLNEQKYTEIVSAYNSAVAEVKAQKENDELLKKVNAEAEKRLKAKQIAEAKEQKQVVENKKIDEDKAQFEALVNARLADLEKANENKKV